MRRRTLLGLGAGVGFVAGGITWLPESGAADVADPARIVRNMVTRHAGSASSNAYVEARSRTAAIVGAARKHIAAFQSAGGDAVFTGLPLGESEANLAKTFQYLAEIALATRLPGGPADLYGNQDLQLRVLDAFALVHQRWYGDQQNGYYGNWFHWEIGMSTQISLAFALLADPLREYNGGLLSLYVASMDAYLRNGVNGDVDLDSRFHTGANLADIAANRIVQGALLGNDARISKAVSDQLTVYATVDPGNLVHGVTDGFYADGSFLQHSSVAYTGSYGKNLLSRSVQMIADLVGTRWSRQDDLVPVVHRWITESFAPVIFEGWMMEAVKGRGVSRTTTGYSDVIGVVESAVDLSGLADEERSRELAGWVKHLVAQSPVPPSAGVFSSPLTAVRYTQILTNPGIPAVDVVGDRATFAFNSMERNVHVRPGWTFTLARNSSRISKYEYMNGENLQPWFQGEGAHYLYLGGQDQRLAYGVDHFTCVSAHCLAGVTAPEEERPTVPEAYDGARWYENPAAGFTSSSELQNEYVYFPVGTSDHSGGATLDRFASVAMRQSDDVTWRDRRVGKIPAAIDAHPNAQAVRSWFLLDDEVVLLGAGITDSDDLTRPRPLRTTVDTRIFDPSDDVTVTVHGQTSGDGGPGRHRNPAWVLWEDATHSTSVGYHFLTPAIVQVSMDRRTESRRTVRLSNPDTAVTKDVFGLALAHRAGGIENYAIALVPGATRERLEEKDHQVEVVINSTTVQAIRHGALGVTMINTFGDQRVKVGDVVVTGAASVVISEEGPTIRLAVTDPTTARERVQVELMGAAWQFLGTDDRTISSAVPGGIRLDFDTRALHGESIVVTLRRGR